MSEMSTNPTDVENTDRFSSIATIKNSAELVADLMKIWEKYDFYDKNLWDCFREIFEDTNITETKFKKIDKIELRKLRKFLIQRGV